MINLIEARSPQGDLLTMSLLDDTQGIRIENIDGLDPVKATISSSDYAQMPGAQFQTSHRSTRNIVITAGLEPDYLTSSVSQLRRQVYAFFKPEAEVALRFYTDDGLVRDSFGTVESCSAPLFTDEPQAVISVICFDPDFTETSPTVLAGTTVSNASSTLVGYDGDEPSGFIFTLAVDRTLTEFSIYNRTRDGSVSSMDFAAALVVGDLVTIDTVNGEMSASLTRSGVTNSVLYAVSSQSSWIQFQPGANQLRVYAVGAALSYSLTYTTRYGGL